MKKFLSLVMALVMTMSLVTIGAGATEYKDLTDKDEIQYEEAVAVLNKLGIISGYEDGSFRPTGALTRGAAAKIIVSLMIGPEAANALTVNTAPYSDVPVTNTFAAVISYCKTAGYINGYTDGTFRPTAALTGYAFTKMLLGALGYDGVQEGFTGEGWIMNVNRLGNVAGLFNDFATTFKGNDGVNRESACLLALNTLKATQVEYSGGTSITTSTGDATTSVSTQKVRSYKVSNNTKINKNIKVGDAAALGNNHYTLEFGEEHFPDLVLDNARNATVITDDYGRPSNQWSYKNVKIGTYPIAANYTFTAGASGDTTVDEVKSMGLKDYNFDSNSVLTVNGRTGTLRSGATTLQANADTLSSYVKNGSLVQVYLSDTTANLITHVAVTQTQIMQVNRVTSGDVTLSTVEDWGINKTKTVVNAVEDDDDAYAVLKDLKSDDYVVITPLWNGSSYDVDGVFIPTTASGSITKVKVNSKDSNTSGLTIGDTDYSMSRNWTADGADGQNPTTALNGTSVTARQNSTVYLDSYGYAIYVSDVKATTSYFLYDESYSSVVDGKIHYYAQGWDTKGNAVSLDLGTAYSNVSGLSSNTVYAYKVSTSGTNAEYQIDSVKTGTHVVGGTVTGSNWEANLIQIGGKYFASGVKYIFSTLDDNIPQTVDTVTVKDGAQKVSTGVEYQYVLNDDKDSSGNWAPKIIAVFLKSDKDVEVSQNVLYVQKQTYALDSNGKTTSIFTAYINGEKKTDLVANKKVNDNTFYTYSVNETTGVYTLNPYTTDTAKATSVITGAILPKDAIQNNAYILGNNLTYTLNGTDKTVAGDLSLIGAQIIDLRSGGTLSSAKDMADANYTNYVVSIVYNDSSNSATLGRVAYVYITGTNGTSGGGGGPVAGDGKVGTYATSAAVNSAGNVVIEVTSFAKADFVPNSANITFTADVLVNGVYAGSLRSNNTMSATNTSARFVVSGTGAVSGDSVTLENVKAVTDKVSVRYFDKATGKEVTKDNAYITADAGNIFELEVGTDTSVAIKLVSSDATGTVKYTVTDNGKQIINNTTGTAMVGNILTLAPQVSATGTGYVDVTLDKSAIVETFSIDVTAVNGKTLAVLSNGAITNTETLTITAAPDTSIASGTNATLKAKLSGAIATLDSVDVIVTINGVDYTFANVLDGTDVAADKALPVTGDVVVTASNVKIVPHNKLAVVAATTNWTAGTMTITFNETLDKDAAETKGNYTATVASGATIDSAKLSADGKTVTLTFVGGALAVSDDVVLTANIVAANRAANAIVARTNDKLELAANGTVTVTSTV